MNWHQARRQVSKLSIEYLTVRGRRRQDEFRTNVKSVAQAQAFKGNLQRDLERSSVDAIRFRNGSLPNRRTDRLDFRRERGSFYRWGSLGATLLLSDDITTQERLLNMDFESTTRVQVT